MSNKVIEQNTTNAMERLRKAGWKGRYVLGSEGYLLHPGEFELMKQIDDKRRKKELRGFL
jgi:hypothetical protein